MLNPSSMSHNIKLLTKLKNAPVSENLEDYKELINELTRESAKDILSLLTRNNNEEDAFKYLLSLSITKIAGLSTDSASELTNTLPYILASIKKTENPISILFQLLENLSQRKDEIARLKILELLSSFEFSVMNIVNLLYKADTDVVVSDILKIKENMVDDFIRKSIKIDNPVVAKNISLVLPVLPPKFFVNYNSFLFLFESENHHLRNCLLDILQVLALCFKDHENIEAIRDVTQHISERLNDANFYVRSKALAVIGELFRKECILKDQRNTMIKGIMERARDKTVIVRKKSIGLLSQILINHPFKDCEYLERKNSAPKTETQKRITADFNEFVEIMESCLSLIVSLLDYSLKTDLVEISSFIKAAYLLKLAGAKQAIQKTLGIVFTKDKDVIVDVFRDILAHSGEILYEFINDRAFETILGYLDVDEKMLYKNIFGGERVFEGVYVLKQLQRPVSESNALSLLQQISESLFRSRDEEEVRQNIETYINTLCIIKCLKRRTASGGDILTLCIKNVIKMMFFERSVIKHTVELIYCVSDNPEATVGKFLKALCITGSTLKIVDAVGWVALNEYYLLERMERRVRGGKGVGERLAAIRESLDGIREKRKSLEDSRRLSLSGMSRDRSADKGHRLSLKFGELEEALKNKTDEEVADFFFYLKEREILYSENSMLFQFLPLVEKSLESPNDEIQAVAHGSLFKCMLTSSEFFSKHKNVLLSALSSQFVTVKNNAIVAFHDFLIFYNTALDPSVLFEKIGDKDTGKNAMLVVFNLLQKNIIRVKGNAVRLVSHLFDEDLGPVVKTLVKNLSGNNNVISVVFYETFMSDLGSEFVEYLASFVSPSIHESLFLKCLGNRSDIERLRVIYENFELGEKFLKENMFRNELKEIMAGNSKA